MSAKISESPLKNLPTVPPPGNQELLATPFWLLLKRQLIQPALDGLTRKYTIGGDEATQDEFLFPPSSADNRQPPAPDNRPLDMPWQFDIGWTNYANVYRDAVRQQSLWASTLTDPYAATREFWPTIANHGFGYNLLFLEQVSPKPDDRRAKEFKDLFGNAWTNDMDRLQAAGKLYAIDLRIFEEFSPSTTKSPIRFTPGTLTLLGQGVDAKADSKALQPMTVRVSSQGRYQIYSASSKAWLYALQAAKTSATVYGIWLGHVYHLHIVTGAMLFTFQKSNFPKNHIVYQLLQPRSDYLIGFDYFLLNIDWTIAPPTSFDTPDKFRQLADRFASIAIKPNATGREFFDDDPKVKIGRQGLKAENFTRSAKSTAWDLYPVAEGLLRIWDIVENLVNSCVDATYKKDEDVAKDGHLKTWMNLAAAPSPSGGNVRGLPKMNNKKDLKDVLTSLIYRVTAHGISRLNKSVNPVLTFMANYPPCLQSTEIPKPDEDFTKNTKKLLEMLPQTRTMGEQLRFYYVFVFSPPYVPLIPLLGVANDLPFPGGLEDERNKALIEFRNQMIAFIHAYDPWVPEQVGQWELNIET